MPTVAEWTLHAYVCECMHGVLVSQQPRQLKGWQRHSGEQAASNRKVQADKPVKMEPWSLAL